MACVWTVCVDMVVPLPKGSLAVSTMAFQLSPYSVHQFVQCLPPSNHMSHGGINIFNAEMAQYLLQACNQLTNEARLMAQNTYCRHAINGLMRQDSGEMAQYTLL